MSYKSINGVGYLALFLKPYKKVNGIESEPTAFLYGGPKTPLPSWVPGLVAAGKAGEGSSTRPSPGKVYHRLVRENYQHQTVKGQDKVRELKEMMK